MTAGKKLLESRDGKCPHCASTFVVKMSVFGNERGADDGDGNDTIIYKCYTCNKEFTCIVPE